MFVLPCFCGLVVFISTGVVVGFGGFVVSVGGLLVLLVLAVVFELLFKLPFFNSVVVLEGGWLV